jgi:hypothetical protein
MYFLDGLGHIERTKEIDCSNDAEAIAELESEGCYAELWQRDRFVKSTDTLIGAGPANGAATAKRKARPRQAVR